MFLETRTFARLQMPLAKLACENVFVGTSSWKYPGWCGQIYDESRYVTRKKFSESRFQRDCLSEYSETFPTLCVDAGYYRFPSEKYLAGLCAQVPSSFRFGQGTSCRAVFFLRACSACAELICDSVSLQRLNSSRPSRAKRLNQRFPSKPKGDKTVAYECREVKCCELEDTHEVFFG